MLNTLSFLPIPLLQWYGEHARDLPWRREPTPYRVWGSEIMLQQTRVAAVLGYFAKFMDAFPTVQDLAAAPEDQLMKLWQGLGYYSRARNLQKAARQIVDTFGGVFPTDYGDIRSLAGVGDYTAAAIASISFGQPVPAVDGNVLRVLSRLFARDWDITSQKVKQLAEQLFDGPDPLIRLDMSEYMEKYAVSRMIGSPPGYVGYEEAGQLTEKVRRRPYSVVLFDEIEKAHPDVMNILLQILDEGKINDAQGRTVDFSNTVICMTSNAGSSDQSTGGLGFNKSEEQLSEEKTRKALAQFLRPEFLGRVDEVIAFKPLSEETLQGIAALMLDEYKSGMDAKGIAYSYTPAALKALVKKSQGGKFGARDLRRTIRKAVEDPAAERLIDGSLASGGTLVVDADENGEVVLK